MLPALRGARHSAPTHSFPVTRNMFIPQAPATETKLLIMGSILSQPLEPVKVAVPVEAASSTNPVPLEASGTPTSPEQRPLFNNCWSCRVLSGSGLIGAGGYVYWVARKPMKLGYPPSPGTVTQMVIGISIACWGIVILADPKGKAYRFG